MRASNLFGLRRDYTLMICRFEASGYQNPDAEIADFVQGLANPKALRLMFELYDGHELADFANRALANDAAVDDGLGADGLAADDTEGWDTDTDPAPARAAAPTTAPVATPGAAPQEPLETRRSPRLEIAAAAAATAPAADTAAPIVNRRRRRTSAGGRRVVRRTSVP